MAQYQRAKGKEWAIALPAFGESIDYKKNTRRKLESRWERGVYVGVHPNATERIVGASKGVYVVQSVRRVPESERYNWEAMASVRGLPWKPVPDGPDDQDAFELPAPVELHPDSPEAPAVPVEAADQERAVRRYYITAKDLEKYGRSDGCAACDASKANIPRGGIAHAPGCRERIEASVKVDPRRSTRYSAAQDKITGFIAKRVAEGAVDNERDGKRREGEPGNTAATSSHDPQGLVHASAAVVQSAETSTEMRVDSGKGLRRSAESEAQPSGGVRGMNQLAKDMVELFMGPEDAISGVLKEHREQVLAQIANLGSEMAVCEEEPFEWDLEEGDDVEPEDHWYVGNLSGKVLPDDFFQEARMGELKIVDKIKLWEVEPRSVGVEVIPTKGGCE
jgi:hypothetical protein